MPRSARSPPQRSAISMPKSASNRSSRPCAIAISKSRKPPFSPSNVRALGEIGGQAVVRSLLGALRSTEGAVCAAAVEALGKTEAEEVIQPISGMLRHQNAQVRIAAVEGLAQLRAPETVEAITPYLQ